MKDIRLHLSAAALAALPLTPAGAQEAFQLDEITVFANLAPTALDSVGSSVTVISDDELQAAGDMQVSDYLNRLPGVTVAPTGPMGSTTALRIRGAHQRYVAVYIDGVLVNDPSSPESAFNFGSLTTADIGRIEVLRGSQSALYGGSAVGGVINITSRTSDEPGVTHSYGLEGGSYGTVSGRYGFTNRSESGEVTLNLSHTRSDGFSATDESPMNPDPEADGFETTRLSFSARHRMSDTLTLGASGFAQRSRSEYDFWPVDGDLKERRREFGGRVFAELDAGQILHTFDVTAYRLHREDRDLAAGTPPDRFEGTRLGASYVGTTQARPDLRLSWGAEVSREISSGVAPFTGYPRHHETVGGLFAEAQWAATDTLDISASGRVERHSEFGTFPTGRVAMAWRATNALTLRAALSNGYRAPAPAERFRVGGNPDLVEETSRSAEVGAEYAFANGARVQATLFALNNSNEIAWVEYEPYSWREENIESTRRRGLELEGSLPLGARARLSANYTYIDAEITGGPDAGNRLLRVPRHDVSLSVNADITDRLRGSFTVQHVADRFDRLTSPTPSGDWTGPLPDYTVANMNLRYGLNDSTDLTLRVDNIFNTQYQQVAGYGTSGRAAYIGISGRF